MKFLQIGETSFINTERIDGFCYKQDGLNVYIGGSDEPWSVSDSYVEDVLAWCNEHLEDAE